MWLLSIAEFAYNNAKNASTGYTSFKLNCQYHLRISYKHNLNPRSQSKTAKKLSSELQNLMAACQQILYHAQKLQKRVHDKDIKLQSYTPSNTARLNSKHLKTKRNYKPEAKFLGLF